MVCEKCTVSMIFPFWNEKEFLMQLSILGPMAWLLKDTARAVGEAEEAENT